MQTYSKRKITVKFRLAQGELGAEEGPEIKVENKRCVATLIAYNGDLQGQLHLSIWGLTLSEIDNLTTIGPIMQERRRNRVVVEAGDSSGMVTLFDGQIDTAYGDFQGAPENVFNILALSATYSSVDHAAPVSFKGGKEAVELLKDIADRLGYTFETNECTQILRNPYFSGSSIQQIKDICRAAGFYWTIDRGVLAIWSKTNGFRIGDVVNISPEAGMVGYPAFSSAGVIITSLFNPEIKQGGRVKVTSDLTVACGEWKVCSVMHSVSSELPDGPWFTQATCLRQI